MGDYSSVSRLFKHRINVAAILCVLMVAGLFVRLAGLQIVEYAHFSVLSENNRIRVMALPPNRGLIYDRNGVILAENRPTFHLELIPEQIDDLEATLKALSKIVSLSERDVSQFRSSMRAHQPFESISLRTRLDDVEVARLAVNRHRFPGMDVSARLTRHYPQGESAVHTIGYVGRINEKEMQRIDQGNYRGTSHIGKIGLEQFYEDELHGTVGQQSVEVNAEGRIISVVDKVPPVAGNNLFLSLDIELQKVAEAALGDQYGSVVAMVPKTGEILALASTPTYDPNLFVHGISYAKYEELQTSEGKPLFNRVLYGQYPPGSTIKPFVGLAGLETRTVGVKEEVNCRGYYLLPGDKTERKYRDWKKTGHGHVDIEKAIVQSCDVYFYDLAHRMGIDRMHDFLAKFNFGEKTGIDLYGERSGLLPSSDWKAAVHRRVWYPGETLSAGIGQGYVLTTPLQLAVATATLANKGESVQPHLLKSIQSTETAETKAIEPKTGKFVLRNPAYWDVVHRAMRNVAHGARGTARGTGRGMSYEMAGKTGTSQVFGIAQDEEYDEETVARKLRDHGLFIAFAPVENPEIVVAVVVENGEHGSWMAPIAREVMDHYLMKTGSVNKAAAK
ncbi:MAG: penicillin-binding protein 2 [Gammaproteobacteria bacterium]|jgi:penicillin-binding protein 2|nr:penicillin-binding protein 2 [Gammaproteobacteria bacterium]